MVDTPLCLRAPVLISGVARSSENGGTECVGITGDHVQRSQLLGFHNLRAGLPAIRRDPAIPRIPLEGRRRETVNTIEVLVVEVCNSDGSRSAGAEMRTYFFGTGTGVTGGRVRLISGALGGWSAAGGAGSRTRSHSCTRSPLKWIAIVQTSCVRLATVVV